MLLRGLGGLALEGADLRRPKPLLLLLYLSLEGPKSRRELADLFFIDTRDPRDSLSTAIKHAKQGARGAVQLQGNKVSTLLACDARTFLNLLDAGDLVPALECYRGPLLAGLDTSLCDELEEWVYGTREFLAARARDALIKLGEEQAAIGNFNEAVKRAEAAYLLSGAPELEPREYEHLHALLLAGGSVRAAELRKEAASFGIELLEDEEKARARFVRLGNEHGARARHRLPVMKTSFVGRSSELIEIKEYLAEPSCRLLTLHGMGGIGKSRLAVQAAYESLADGRFSGGIFFVPLAGLTAADRIASSIAEALELNLRPDDALAQLQSYIGNQRLLLLLDNYEHLVDHVSPLTKLLETCPNLNLLITSRARLNLEEEWVLPLEGLPLPRTAVNDVKTARQFDALDLFAQRAKRARTDFVLTEENLPHVIDLCRLVEGSPLGLELAAVWAKLLSCADIAKEMSQSLDFLTTTTRNVSERHRSIRAAFEHSWKLLTPKERDVLASLSVFANGAQREAVAEVTGATIPVLASLLDKSLLRVTGRRYGQHPLLQQYAREKLAERPDAQSQTYQNHSAYFLRFLEKQAMNASRGLSKEALTATDAELPNILVAAQTTLAAGRRADFVTIMRLLAVDCRYYDARGCDAHALSLIHRAAEIAEGEKDVETAHYLHTKLGNFYRELRGDLGHALASYQQALELAQVGHDAHRQVVLLSLTGMVRLLQGSADGHAYLAQAEALAVATGDELARSHVLQNRSHLAFLETNWHEMHRLCREAVETLERLAREPSVKQATVAHLLFFSLLNLGEAEKRLGRFQRALEDRQRALELAKQRDNQTWMAYACQELGEMYHEAQDRVRAQAFLAEALSLYRRNKALADSATLETFMLEERYEMTKRDDHDAA